MVRLIVPAQVRYAGAETLSAILNNLEQQEPTKNNLRVAWAVNNIAGRCLNGGQRVSNMEQQDKLSKSGLGIKYTKSLDEAKAWVAAGRPTIGRLAYHTKAKDVVMPNNRLWSQRDYWVELVEPPFDEWRIHVCMGKVIARGLKTLTGVEKLRFPARNRRNGWTLRHDVEPPKGIRDVARAAVALIGYDFAACDILHKVVDGVSKFYVLEANRAPGLDNYTATAYARAFRAIANHQVPGAQEKTDAG